MTPGVTANRDGSGDPALDEARLTPSVPVTAPEAAEAIRACYGLTGELARLPGEADDNFLLRPSGGGQRYVVKFAHPRADPRVVGVQVRVLRHIESVAAGLPVPRVVPAADGPPWTVVADGPLRGRVVHVLTYLDGELLRSVRTDPSLRRTLGVTLARLGRALREFDDPLVRRPLLWDLAQLPQLRPLLAGRPDNNGTSLLGEQLGRLAAQVVPRLAVQRTQLVHNDFSPDNTLISADASRVRGIIDFGDVTVTALVNDVAIAAAYQLSDELDLLAPVLDLIAGYHATTPLTAGELDLLPDLILARVVARIMWGFQRHGIVPDLAVMGKPMGNGMPIAGVAARPEILAEFGHKIRYFNTFGGNSVSIAAAAAVLDVIETEGPQENARVVGRYLRDTLAGIAGGTSGIGAVRGAGLYAAADFVEPGTSQPDGDAAIRVVNGLRERRVLISATGPHGSTLKIRPPRRRARRAAPGGRACSSRCLRPRSR